VVTVIRGLSARDGDLAPLLAQLKRKCGAGGTLDGDTLELQGDHLDRLRAILGDAGYSVRG
jgi:translation initiation factor 1